MDFLNLNLDTEQLKSFDEQVENLKKPTIPAGKLIAMMLINFGPTKTGAERAKKEGREVNIMDGVAMEFVALGYYKDAQTYVPIIDIKREIPGDETSKIVNVEFPFEGTLGIKLFKTFTIKSLTFQGYLEPKNPQEALTYFRQWLYRELGILPSDKIEEGMIVHARRYIDRYYKKSSYDEKGELKPGAKEETNFVLTCFNREANESMPVPVKYFSGDDLLVLGQAVIDHAKKYEKKDGQASTAVEGVPF